MSLQEAKMGSLADKLYSPKPVEKVSKTVKKVVKKVISKKKK